MNSQRNYATMAVMKTFSERFEYLKLSGAVGIETFGYDRYVNQMFYRSSEWANVREKVILRDSACDLGILDRPIHSRIFIHHINPLSVEDFRNSSDLLFDLENLICCSFRTHNALHFGDSGSLNILPIERKKGDTLLW